MKTNFKIENYKDIKNYIHNYLGLTKEEVRQMVSDTIQKTIETEIEKYFKDEEKLKSLIEKEIIRQLKFESGHERRSFIRSTLDGIYNRIDEVIHKEVTKRLIIELREPDETEITE